jgi:hypothetical protein
LTAIACIAIQKIVRPRLPARRPSLANESARLHVRDTEWRLDLYFIAIHIDLPRDIDGGKISAGGELSPRVADLAGAVHDGIWVDGREACTDDVVGDA